MRRNQWVATLFAILLFGCGAVCGALVERYFNAPGVSAKNAEDFRHHYVSEMKSRLRLTADQTNKLEVILDETKAKYKAVRDQSRPAMLQIKEEQIRRVKSILTADQVPAYDRLIAEREQRFREQEERERHAEVTNERAHRALAAP